MRRWIVLIAILVAVVGCSESTAPQQGFVVWRIDGVSCTGSDVIGLYIDGELVGAETLTAGGPASKPYSVTIGSHLIGAREVNPPNFIWPNQSRTITVGTTFTTVLTC